MSDERIITAIAADLTACPICGRESCEDHQPTLASNSSRRPRLAVVRAQDLIDAPRPIEIVEGMAWAGCVTVLAAESSAGKTFLLLDLAAAVSAGLAWHGRMTHRSSVFYVSYEGDALGLRLRALRDVAGRRLEHLYIARAHEPLSPHLTRDGEARSTGEVLVTEALDELRTALLAAVKPPLGLVIVDTVRASLAGSEDSSEHVAAYLRAVRRLLAPLPDVAAILAHHAGWQDGDGQRKRERGSSAWRGNSDATLYLEAGDYDSTRGAAELILRALKVRDADRPPPLHLVRRRVALLERDVHGDPVTSCIIERDPRTGEDRAAAQVAAAETAHHATDVAVLKAMRDYPAATSISRLRPYVGVQTAAVGDAVARILRLGWALEGKRGQPFTLTAAGFATLNGEPSP